MNQIELHTTIDRILAKGTASVSHDIISSLIRTNNDAKQYFFSNADEHWLKWLWKNGFLEGIKEKAPDPSSYGFRMPELHYLVNVAEKIPDIVKSIINSFGITSNNFNPEVVDQFTRISSKLPARCLKHIVKKIRDEKWVVLMGNYTQYGFEYADMLETLHKAGDYESLLILIEGILLVRRRKKTKKKIISYSGDNIFYIHDLPETKVFTYLAEMPSSYMERALVTSINTFSEVISDDDGYMLIDEDLFALSLSSISGHTYNEELKYLVASIIDQTRKIFSSQNLNKKNIFKKYFDALPEKQITRRLKLFVLSLDPQLFVEELMVEYFKLFKAKKILDILYGAEYESALKAGFSFLTDTQKRKYVSNVLSLFSNSKDKDEKKWKRHYASCILSTISHDLTQDEIVQANKYNFKIDSSYRPEPSIRKMRGGTVTPRSPVDFTQFSVKEIAEKLKGELTPDELQKKYRGDDFLNPRDADGVAEQLKADIKNRASEYIKNATLFFDREKLIPHYTHAYLRGIKDALSENRNELKKLSYDELLKLLLLIKSSGERRSFSTINKDSQNRWLSSWNSVHTTIADLVEELIKQKDKNTILNFKKDRSKLLKILEYLLTYDDPVPEDEKLKTAKMTVRPGGESEYYISDPFSIAINSVRGQAFQALLHFVYKDASTNEKVKLADDVKAIYAKLLERENTRSIMFMFGHYLPTFHFRDMTWTRNMLAKIFADQSKDKYLQLAAWEGYLSNNLYKELFFEPYIQKLYVNNIVVDLTYPKQKFFKDPHESLAIHLALAFVHYETFGLDNTLFKGFLAKASEKQLSAFVSFLGRSYIAGENANILKDDQFPWRIKRVQDFWKLMLKDKKHAVALSEFGTWIDLSKNIFETKWLADKIRQTLDVTSGEFKWDYGLMKSIESLAYEEPQDTIAILEKHFMYLIEYKKQSFPIQEDKEWYNAFRILYENKDKKIKDDTYNLINSLIEKGGKQFWSLENIVKRVQ